MIICDDLELVFLAIPKTGTRSIYKVLKEEFGGRQFGEHTINVPDEYKHYKTFTILRNPFERLVSVWKYMTNEKFKKNILNKILDGIKKHGTSFESFVDYLIDEGIYYQTRNIRKIGILRGEHFVMQSLYMNLNRIDYVLNFDNLSQDFKNMIPEFRHLQLPHENKSTYNTSWFDYYQDHSVTNKVNILYSWDIITYNKYFNNNVTM